MEELDIKWKGSYPANALSNYYAHEFCLDGIACASMEGFLQALKYRDPKQQIKICRLTDEAAKDAGKHKTFWKFTGILYWQGKRYRRSGKNFYELRRRAYRALFQNKDFAEALRNSKGMRLKHSYGAHKKRETILTEEEFLSYLEELRSLIE